MTPHASHHCFPPNGALRNWTRDFRRLDSFHAMPGVPEFV